MLAVTGLISLCLCSSVGTRHVSVNLHRSVGLSLDIHTDLWDLDV